MAILSGGKIWQKLARGRVAGQVARDLAGPRAREELLAQAGHPGSPAGLARRVQDDLARFLPLAGRGAVGSFGEFFDASALMQAVRGEAVLRCPQPGPEGPLPASRIRLTPEEEHGLWPWTGGQRTTRLARAALLTGDQDLVDALERSFRDFCLANPPLSGPGWLRLQVVAARVVNWLLALALWGDLGRLEPEVVADVLGHLNVAGMLLEQRLMERAAQPSLELVLPATALMFAGHCLPFLPRAGEWLAAGSRSLGPSLAAWKQPGRPLATAALAAISQSAGLAQWLAMKGNIAVPGLTGGLLAPLAFCRLAAPPWGAGLGWGYTPLTSLFNLDPRRGDPWSVAANLGALLTDQAEFRAGRRLEEELFWLFGGMAADKLRLLAGGRPPQAGDQPGPGLTVLAGSAAGRSASVWIATGGRQAAGPGAWPARSLALGLCLEGRPVLVPPGPAGGGPLGPHLRARAAMNAARLDGVEPVGGRVSLETLELSPRHQFLSAVYDGYRHLADPVTLRRRVYLDLERGHLGVVDQLQCEGEHVLEVFFHLPPASEVRAGEHGVLIIEGEFGRVFLKQETEAETTLVAGVSNPPLGWLAVDPGRVVAAPVIRQRARTVGNARFSTMLAWG
ncbi:MAG: heparinase II/III-family protein [Deltaproteobacteria bacterium]|nr:heparinase II/III-family protein [Deltaproteobacteria bacterium]